MTLMLRSVMKLASGRTIATAIPFLTAPILGRLYTPSDYSNLTLFLSLNAVISVFVTFQMHHSLALEDSDRAATSLAWIALAIAGAVSVGVAVATVLVALAQGAGTVWGWMFLLPVSVLLNGMLRVTELFATRERRFGFIARVLVAQVVTTAVASILFGFWVGGSVGLFLGFFLGQTVQVAQQFQYLRQRIAAAGFPSKPRARALIRRHRDFMVFSTPSALIQTLAIELPTFALSALTMTGAVGAFGRVRQIISAPVNLTRSSVSQVFQREAAELYRTTGSCRRLMFQTAAWLFAVGIVPTLLLVFYGPSLLALYLGPGWEQAGVFAQILAPMLLARLVAAPTASVYFATGHQRLEAKLAVAAFVMVATGVGVSLYLGRDAISVVTGYAVATTAVYLMYFAFAVRISSR